MHLAGLNLTLRQCFMWRWGVHVYFRLLSCGCVRKWHGKMWKIPAKCCTLRQGIWRNIDVTQSINIKCITLGPEDTVTVCLQAGKKKVVPKLALWNWLALFHSLARYAEGIRPRMCGKIFPPLMLSPNVATFDASLQDSVSLQSLWHLKTKDFVSLQSVMKFDTYALRASGSRVRTTVPARKKIDGTVLKLKVQYGTAYGNKKRIRCRKKTWSRAAQTGMITGLSSVWD